MAFNFNITSNPVANSRKSLQPWGIYNVKFDGFEVRTFAGKKDPNVTYKVMDFKFSNDDGSFTLTKFWPRDEDGERQVYDQPNGGKRITASNFEELMQIIKQAIYVLSPKGYEKLEELSKKSKGFSHAAEAADAITAIAEKILKSCVGQETQIKLTGYIDKTGKPVTTVPKLLYVDPSSNPDPQLCEARTTNNWIGSKLFFSEYEEGQRAKFHGTKPSDPEKSAPVEQPEPTTDDDMDWDELAKL